MTKRLSFILLLATLTSFAFGQTNKYLPYAWGMMKFGDTLLIDETEIRVGEYLDFLFYQDASKFKNYLLNKSLDENEKKELTKVKINKKLLPDATILSDLSYGWLFKKCNTCSTITFSSVSSTATILVEKDSVLTKRQENEILDLLELPIVGVNYEQAILFCNWRTAKDSLIANIHNNQPKWEYTKLKWSLPTPIEFDVINPSQDSVANKKGIVSNYNYKNAVYKIKPDNQNNICGKTSMKVSSFFRSSKSILHSTVDIQGNVAEMTSINGISKGGSFFHYATDTYKGKAITYVKPEKWLGFRCVARLRDK